MKKQIKQLMVTAILLAISSYSSKAQWALTGNAGTTPATNFIGTTDLNSFNIRTNNQNRITVAADGKVGIGTTTPGFALDVQSTGSANLNFKSTTGTANLLLDRANSAATSSVSYRTNGVGTWQTGTVGTDNFAIRNLSLGSPAITVLNANNNVGIGINAPTAALHVQRSALADVLVKSTGDGAQLTIDRAGNGWEAVTRYAQTGTTLWKTGLNVNASGTAEYVIRNENIFADALTITSSNNAVSLHSGKLYLGNSDLITNGNDLRINASIPGIGFGSPGNINMALPALWGSAGNVSIGTTDASRAKFVVQGNVGKTNAIFGQGSSGISLVQNWPGIGFNSFVASTTWKSSSPGYGAQISLDPSSGVMYFATSNIATASDQAVTGTTALVINPTGAVGINYTAASSTLDVGLKAGTSATASFWGTNTGFATHFCQGTNENTYIRGGQTGSNVILADVGTQSVGIGTTNPAYKLDVCGTMRAKEVRVATGWCDYVFADDYKLPALNDVEAFIKANKHLPDVTPGSVIEGEGLEVGKTSAQMIKKIEELTLYVIDLQKQVNDLKTNKK